MRPSLPVRCRVLLAVALLLPAALAAQTPDSARLAAYAAAHTEIGALRDAYHQAASASENKTDEAIAVLQEALREDVAAVLERHGFTAATFARLTFVVSTDAEARRTLDSLLGIEVAEPEPELPDNPHVRHVLMSFVDAPEGLLAMAEGEAAVAAQHAALAASSIGDLDAMRLHAGHVAHALAPAEGSRGPGAGFGLVRAAGQVAQHTELAALAEGASETLRTHAAHVITAATAVRARAEALVALAERLAAATSAAEAEPLAAELGARAAMLTAGEDTDGDGRIGWQGDEGGLQHVAQHLQLMIGG